MESDNNKPKKVVYFKMPPPSPYFATTLNAFSEIRKSLKELRDSSKKEEDDLKQNLLKYFKSIEAKLKELKDEDEKRDYLLNEKRKFEGNVIEAQINKDGYDRHYYKQFLDIIIYPLLKSIESDLELSRKLESKKILELAKNTTEAETKNKKPIQETAEIISKLTKPDPKLPAGFSQIKCDATQDQILNYFLILSKEKNTVNNEIFMEENDIFEFVKKNFSVFNFVPTGDYFLINLLPRQKRTLIYFVFQFYLKYDRKVADTKIKYTMLLINNFELFKHDKPKILLSNMSESKRPVMKNIITTKIHLSK